MERAAVEVVVTLSFFVLSESGLDSLLQAAASIAGNSVLSLDGASYQVIESELSQEVQAAVFAAAKIALQPALSYTLKTVVTIEPRGLRLHPLPLS